MVDRDVVDGKLAELEQRVGRIRDVCPAAAEELARDQNALDLVSFNLMLAIQSCADIASHAIADEGWPTARSLVESFERLHAHGVLSAETTRGMKSAVTIRNIVAHGYSRADPQKIHTAATQGLGVLRAFAADVAAWTAGSPIS